MWRADSGKVLQISGQTLYASRKVRPVSEHLLSVSRQLWPVSAQLPSIVSRGRRHEGRHRGQLAVVEAADVHAQVVLAREGPAAHRTGERDESLVHAALVSDPVHGLFEPGAAVPARQGTTCETGAAASARQARAPPLWEGENGSSKDVTNIQLDICKRKWKM